MKKGALLKRLKSMGCVFVKHGKKHDVYKNPRTGVEERVPRHSDINENLANHILRTLS
jgi:predicted RNA binding protein YcfA (HicA-like mRNA interferase family)